MARQKFKIKTDQRPFIIVYQDFLESDVLDFYEKMVFIALKKFADNNSQCFPSLKKLVSFTGLSKRKIQDILKTLEKKNVIQIEKRNKSDGGFTSNLYTLHDFKELWNADNNEDMTTIINEYEEERIIQILKNKGYKVTKEKEPDNTAPTKEQYQQAPELTQFDIVNSTTDSKKSQTERYTIEQIQQIYDYDVMLIDRPHMRDNIDSVINVLHNALNTTKDTIRIAGEDKPAMVVVGKLMKIDKDCIIYAIEKYQEQTDRIKNPTGYMLTLLYNSREQMNLDITNQVQYNMKYHW